MSNPAIISDLSCMVGIPGRAPDPVDKDGGGGGTQGRIARATLDLRGSFGAAFLTGTDYRKNMNLSRGVCRIQRREGKTILMGLITAPGLRSCGDGRWGDRKGNSL